jgi:hypothetical protein
LRRSERRGHPHLLLDSSECADAGWFAPLEMPLRGRGRWRAGLSPD